MSGDVANAALLVAIGLLVLAALARAVIWAQVDDEAERTARLYLEPLTTWSLVAVGLYAVALGAAGRVTGASLAVPLILGAGAVLLRGDEAARDVATEVTEQRTAAPQYAAEPSAPQAPASEDEPGRSVAPSAPTPAAGGSLWTRHAR